jgi:hypothetical protein
VIEYASGKTDGDRARGARLIQTAALIDYPRHATCSRATTRNPKRYVRSLLNEHLRKYIEATRPSAEEEDSKRRGLLILNQLGERWRGARSCKL